MTYIPLLKFILLLVYIAGVEEGFLIPVGTEVVRYVTGLRKGPNKHAGLSWGQS